MLLRLRWEIVTSQTAAGPGVSIVVEINVMRTKISNAIIIRILTIQWEALKIGEALNMAAESVSGLYEFVVHKIEAALLSA